MSMTGRERLPQTRRLLAAAAVLALVAAPAASARQDAGPASATPPPVTGTGCEEHEAWVDGDSTAVAAVLPKGFTPVQDGNGDPIVFARAEHCGSFISGGHSQPVTIADWGVVVNSPDGTGCATGLPTVGTTKGDLPPICNWYTLGLVTDDRQIVSWLRQGTPSIPASYAPQLAYRDGPSDPLGRTPFHFAGPSLTIDDTSSLRPGTLSLRGGYWFHTPQGTVKMIISTDDLTTGPADTTLTAVRGSTLSRLMGATQRASVQPYAQFGVIHADHGVLRKQLFGPRLVNEPPLRTFAGSCSFQGQVTFNPPATTSQADTTYTYDAAGACTGRLDGADISSAPAHWKGIGHSNASCVQALAFPPGTVTVTFPGQRDMSYTFDFTSEATELDGTIYGARSGQASVHASFLNQQSSPTGATQCTTGLKHAAMDLSFATQSQPLTS
jgi:hypothetical protein